MKIQVYFPLLCVCAIVACKGEQGSLQNATITTNTTTTTISSTASNISSNGSSSETDGLKSKNKRALLDITSVDITTSTPPKSSALIGTKLSTSSGTASSTLNGWPVSAASIPSSGSESSPRTASASFHSVSFTNPPASSISSFPSTMNSQPQFTGSASTLNFASSPFLNTYPQYLHNSAQPNKQFQQLTAASSNQQSSPNSATLIPLLHTIDSHKAFPHVLNFASVPTSYLSASLQQQGISSATPQQSKGKQLASASKQAPKAVPQASNNQHFGLSSNNHHFGLSSNNQPFGIYSFGSQPLLSYSSSSSPVVGQTGNYQFFAPPPTRNGIQFGQPASSSVHPQTSAMKSNSNTYPALFGGQGSWPFLNTDNSQILGSSAQQPLLYYPGQQYGTGNLFGFPSSGGFFPQNPFLQSAENTDQQNIQGETSSESSTKDSGSQLNGDSSSSTVKQPPQVKETPESSSSFDDSSSKSPSKSSFFDSDDETSSKYKVPSTDHQKIREYSSGNYKPSSSGDSSSYTESSGGKYADDDDDDDDSDSSHPSKSSSSHYSSEDDDEGEGTKQSGYYKKPYSSYGKPNQYSNDGAYYKSYSSSYVKPPKTYKTSYSKPYNNHRYEDEETKPSSYHKTSTSRYRKPYQYRGDDDDQDGSSDSSEESTSHYHGAESQRTKPLGSETFDDLQFQFSKSFDNLRDDALPSPSENSDRSNHRHGKKSYHGYPREQHESSSNEHAKTLHRYPYKAPRYSSEGPVSYFRRQGDDEEEDSDGNSSNLSPVRVSNERQKKSSYNWSYHQHEIMKTDPEVKHK